VGGSGTPSKRRAESVGAGDGTSKHFKRPVAAQDDARDDEKAEHTAGEDEDPRTPSKKQRKRPPRPFADPSVYAHLGEDPLSDYMVPDGKLMLCGINPGRLSAERGLHCASFLPFLSVQKG
jgi:hypothetical protein